jgi:hypothetical protein
VLERRRIAERWRTERWDSLRLQGPNWSVRLPDFPFPHADPDGFATAGEIVEFIIAYACVDGPLGSRASARSLTGGSTAILYPASHEGILVKLFRHAQLRSGRRLSWSGIIQGGALVSAGSPCEPHIRRDTVPTTVPHSGRESSRRAAPLYKTARACQAGQRRRSLGSVGPSCPAAQAYIRPIRSRAS